MPSDQRICSLPSHLRILLPHSELIAPANNSLAVPTNFETKMGLAKATHFGRPTRLAIPRNKPGQTTNISITTGKPYKLLGPTWCVRLGVATEPPQMPSTQRIVPALRSHRSASSNPPTIKQQPILTTVSYLIKSYCRR